MVAMRKAKLFEAKSWTLIGYCGEEFFDWTGYVDNPLIHVPDWNKLSPQHQQGLIRHWEKEISNFAD
jgi:hypothetical protein